MIITLTNPITGKTTRHRASLTADHVMCHYGQPIMLADGEPLDVANCVLQGAQIIEPPKNKKQIALLEQWQANAQAMIGIS